MGRRICASFRAFVAAAAGGGGGTVVGFRSVSGVDVALELVLITVDGTGVWPDRGEVPCRATTNRLKLAYAIRPRWPSVSHSSRG